MTKRNPEKQRMNMQTVQNLSKIYEAIAEEISAWAVSILEDDNISTNAKINKNTLRASVLRYNMTKRTEISTDGNAVVSILFDNYLQYIENGRKPKYGKRPPIDALKDWAERKNLPTDNDTLWAISSAIWRDGYEGRPIFATLEKRVDEKWQTEWSKEIFDAIVGEEG